jgi:hypothetical protein
MTKKKVAFVFENLVKATRKKKSSFYKMWITLKSNTKHNIVTF